MGNIMSVDVQYKEKREKIRSHPLINERTSSPPRLAAVNKSTCRKSSRAHSKLHRNFRPPSALPVPLKPFPLILGQGSNNSQHLHSKPKTCVKIHRPLSFFYIHSHTLYNPSDSGARGSLNPKTNDNPEHLEYNKHFIERIKHWKTPLLITSVSKV